MTPAMMLAIARHHQRKAEQSRAVGFFQEVQRELRKNRQTVIVAAGGGGRNDGSAVWGSITGTLSNQADLQGALDAKVTSGGALGTPSSGTLTNCTGLPTAGLVDDAVTYAKMQNISATSRILGRKTAAAGDTEECTLSDILDFVGSAAQGDILYRGSSAWARLAAGTSGYVLKTQGASANPAWTDWVGAESGESVLGSTFTITGSAGTYQNTGLSITLPSAGTYLITASIRGVVQVSAGVPAYIVSRLYNVTDSAAVTNSERFVCLIHTTGQQSQNTCGIGVLLTVAASKTIRLEAFRSGGTTYTQSGILSNTDGRTTLGYVRIY